MDRLDADLADKRLRLVETRIAEMAAQLDAIDEHLRRARHGGPPAEAAHPDEGQATCCGALIVHADGTVAACTEDGAAEGCRGREQRHERDSIRCWVWSLAGCDYCGVHSE